MAVFLFVLPDVVVDSVRKQDINSLSVWWKGCSNEAVVVTG
jgi:hypothetical protein